MMKNRHNPLSIFLPAFAVALLLCATITHTSHAADKSPLLVTPTSARDIFIIFNKMAGRTVDFQSTIQNMDAYKKADEPTRAKMLAEKDTLSIRYAGIDPKTEIIVVRSAVDIRATLTKFPGLKITLPGRYEDDTKNKSAIYFPYSWGGQNFALVPDQIETFMNIPMTLQDASDASGRINNGTATLVLEMLPAGVSGKSPMRLDGLSQWLLMTKVVGVTYYNQYLQPIWQWHAKGFVRQDTTSPLQDLKQ